MKKPNILMLGIDGVAAHHIKKQVENGKLPGFARLMKNGVFFGDMMSVFPTISPTCWHSIYTGAVPKVHGAECEMIHRAGDAPWQFGTSYSSKNVHADRIWDVVARSGGKAFLLSPLGGAAEDTSKVTCVKGAAMYNLTPDKPAAEVGISGIPQQYFSVRFVDDTPVYAHGVSMPAAGWKSFDNESVRFAFKKIDTSKAEKVENIDLGDWKLFTCDKAKAIDGNTFEFTPITDAPRFTPDEVEAFTWTVLICGDGKIKIGEGRQAAEQSRGFSYHEWSDVLQRKLKTKSGEEATFTFRAYCEQLDVENGIYGIYITAARNYLKEIVPASKAQAYMDIPEIENICYGDMATNADKFIDSIRFSLEWKKQAIKYATENEECDLIFDFIGVTDSVNHLEIAPYYDMVNVNVTNTTYYTPERARSDYEKVYALVDEHLSWLCENASDENTVIAVCADHGAIATTDNYFPMTILRDAGLTVYNDFNEHWKNEGIDWSKTKAYCFGSCHVNVNLVGREPCGIVEPEDYEKVVNEIIVALHKHGATHAGTHKGQFAFAVPGEQAGFIGLGGDNCGDVVFGLLGGDVGGYFGDVHSVQIPSAKNKITDIRPVCIMSGKNIKKNFLLTRPTDLTDIAPTICYAAGYRQPKDATGGVVFAALED